MNRQVLLGVAWWAITAVVATLISMAALRLVGSSVAPTPGGILTQAEVARELEATQSRKPTPTVTPALTPTSGPTQPRAAGAQRMFSTPGGTVIAECVGAGKVYVVSAAPALGFALSDVERGPDVEAEVEFAGSDQKIEIKIRCVNGELVARQHD